MPQRDIVLGVKITKAEYKLLKKMHKLIGMTQSDFIRFAFRFASLEILCARSNLNEGVLYEEREEELLNRAFKLLDKVSQQGLVKS